MGQKGIDLLKEKGYDVKEAWDVPKDELPEIIGDYDAVIVRSATKLKGDLLEAAENLKVVGRPGIGLDNVDVEKCKERGIAVHNTPNATTNTVAELALAYLFALARPIIKATTTIKDGEWAKKQLKGNELAGKTLGIIGCGRIGSELGRKADALGMNVIGCDVVEIEEACIGQCSLEEVLEQSDYLSIHVPLLPSTKHYLSKEQFDLVKEGVCIVNCARGGVVDEEALYDAIKSGKVRGAAIDVWEEEPIQLESSKKLLELDEVIGSPHIGAQTDEGQQRAGLQAAEAIIKELEKL